MSGDEKKIISRIEAKTLGLSRYFTGKSCKHGHTAERYVVDYGCIQCRSLVNLSDAKKEYEQIWRENNSERTKEKLRIWYIKNSET